MSSLLIVDVENIQKQVINGYISVTHIPNEECTSCGRVSADECVDSDRVSIFIFPLAS